MCGITFYLLHINREENSGYFVGIKMRHWVKICQVEKEKDLICHMKLQLVIIYYILTL